MNISGIDHVEFYVGDARQAGFYFCTAYGFHVCAQGGPETGLVDQRSLLLRQGDISLVLTSGLTPEHPATEYVRRHGDGVAVVGLAVDDATGAHGELVAAGAASVAPPTVASPMVAPPGTHGGRLSSAVVSGFGDVVHRLVERHGPADGLLPGLVPVPGPHPDGNGELLRTIDHLAICVPAGQLAATSRYYQDVFGFAQTFEEYIEVGGQGMDSAVVQSPSRGVTFTLIEPDPTRRPGQINDFLQWHAGAGVQHLAFGVNDIVEAVGALAERGVRFLGTPASYYDTLRDRLGVEVPVEDLRRLSILADRDHWGHLFQIFTESVHVRRTLFLEIIERRGALTFGSGNIRALYEAKERELSAVTEEAAA
ncbi:MAG: 4-hydroxyphenylpyruvate dioxygenase [Actinobacteria bacterium]|nr:MAG: 4-hydroxyphenylpyruvate dioxygenase [Actinomycetota bacterium]